MPSGTKQIKRRIKSIANTKKITKAMELVAGAKMRRAVEAVLKSRSYAKLAAELVSAVGGEAASSNQFFASNKKSTKGLVVVIASDRGLCGSFNTQLFRALEATMADLKQETPELEFVAVGKRAAQFIKRSALPLKAFFENGSVKNSRQIDPIAKLSLDGFLSGHYARVYVAYTDFRGALKQIPSVVTLLPLGRLSGKEQVISSKKEFLFEPSPDEVLNTILPKVFETELYQAILESSASEHSARMIAMRSATDSAAELLDDLVFTYNQVRQGGITKEIIEVSTGASLVN